MQQQARQANGPSLGPRCLALVALATTICRRGTFSSPATCFVTPQTPGRANLVRAGTLLPWLSIATPYDASAASKQGGVLVPSVGGGEVWARLARPGAEVTLAVETTKYAAQWPFRESDFFRLDREDDKVFYTDARLVRHVDDGALAALTAYYAEVFPSAGEFDALDFCSSWVSHYPEAPKPRRLAVSGMNKEELAQNRQATDFTVKDLNEDPRLPYGDEEFDVVTNVVSVDYLTQPREVFKEVARVLRPGGLVIVSFSDRFFITKVVAPWTSEDDAGRAEIVANYLHFAGGFKSITAVDITPKGVSPGGPDGRGRTGDPMYVVSAVKA